MGLLGKATSMSEKEEKAKTKGLLARASLRSESRTGAGLLERAEELLQSEESEAEEGESEGLLQKAQALAEERELPDRGLLEKAKAAAAPKEGLLEKVTVVEEEPPYEAKLPHAGLLQRALQIREGEGLEAEGIKKPPSKKKKARKPRKKKAPARKPAVAKKAEEKMEEQVPEVQVPREPVPRELVKKVQEKDLLGAVEHISHIVGEEGYERLFGHMLQTACKITKGGSGLLFALQGGKFKCVAAHITEVHKRGLKRLSFSERSKLVKLLKAAQSGSVLSSSIGRELSKRDRNRIEAVEPWVAVPILMGQRLFGFLVVGNRQNRAKPQVKDLLFLSHLCAPYVIDYSLSRDLSSSESRLMTQKEEYERILGLYDYTDERGGGIKDALGRTSILFHIETALLVTGWERKGALDVPFGIGVTEEERRRFRVTRGDREIAGIAAKGEPKVPRDAAKRLSRLEEELERSFQTYIVVPVVFHGVTLATLIVLYMKGCGKRLSKETKDKLSHAASFLVPYILAVNLMDIDPFKSLEYEIENSVRQSEKEGASLTLIICTVRNIEKAMDGESYKKYRGVYDRLYRSCREIVAEEGSVKMVSWKRMAILTLDIEPERIEGIVGRIKERFAAIAKREGLQGLALSFKKISYEKDRVGLHGLMDAIY
jgi:hypothetical protein